MGKLLQFASAPRNKGERQTATRRRDGEEGQVILFPGVRIERASLDLDERIGTISRTTGNLKPERD